MERPHTPQNAALRSIEALQRGQFNAVDGATGAIGNGAGSRAMLLPHMRQNFMSPGLSAPQRAQRSSTAPATGAIADPDPS